MSEKLGKILQKIAADYAGAAALGSGLGGGGAALKLGSNVNKLLNQQLPAGTKVQYGGGPAVDGSFGEAFLSNINQGPVSKAIFRDQTPAGTMVRFPAPSPAEVQLNNASRKVRRASAAGVNTNTNSEAARAANDAAAQKANAERKLRMENPPPAAPAASRMPNMPLTGLATRSILSPFKR